MTVAEQIVTQGKLPHGKPPARSTATSLCLRLGISPLRHALTLSLLGQACLMKWHAILTDLERSGGVPKWLGQRIVESAKHASDRNGATR